MDQLKAGNPRRDYKLSRGLSESAQSDPPRTLEYFYSLGEKCAFADGNFSLFFPQMPFNALRGAASFLRADAVLRLSYDSYSSIYCRIIKKIAIRPAKEAVRLFTFRICKGAYRGKTIFTLFPERKYLLHPQHNLTPLTK